VSAAATDVEVDPLEGVDLEAAPPCSMIRQWHLFGLARFLGLGKMRRCGRPSTHRVRVTCQVHGTRLVFLCSRHVPLVAKWGLAGCATCDFRSPLRFGGYA
jgi:hypothetical protein